MRSSLRVCTEVLRPGEDWSEWHEPSRPESVEAEGTGRFATFLENTGATGYVVHLSCRESLASCRCTPSRAGVKIHVESVRRHFC